MCGCPRRASSVPSRRNRSAPTGSEQREVEQLDGRLALEPTVAPLREPDRSHAPLPQRPVQGPRTDPPSCETRRLVRGLRRAIAQKPVGVEGRLGQKQALDFPGEIGALPPKTCQPLRASFGRKPSASPRSG